MAFDWTINVMIGLTLVTLVGVVLHFGLGVGKK